MNLREYEQSKFSIAEILRAGEILISAGKRRDWQDRLQDLFTRLAEDRFNLVVVGRFSRGKTSLMNAILATDRLPTDIVPLTSVITTVVYGSKEQVALKYDSRILDKAVPIDALSRYITQRGNPGNVQKIRRAEIQLPAEILRRGFNFVDTPGFGSIVAESSMTTESFLPEADAFLLVTGFESPLSNDEMLFFKLAHVWGRRIFVVVNKHDTASAEERESALAFVRDQIKSLFGQSAPRVYSVSARDGLEAKRSHNRALLDTSGIPALEDQLISFLLTEKSEQFLSAMCDRTGALLQELPRSAQSIDLIKKTRELAYTFRSNGNSSHGANVGATNPAAVFTKLHELASCEICAHAAERLWEFLSEFQYGIMADRKERRKFANGGGFCPFHTWEYESVASPYGTCVGFPPFLDRLASNLRATAPSESNHDSIAADIARLLPTKTSCALCSARDKAELEAIDAILARLVEDEAGTLNSMSAICLPHLAILSGKIQNTRALRKLMVRQAEIFQRMSEDMSRFALKHNGGCGYLASDEEASAARRAILALAGRRNVNFDHKVAPARRSVFFEDGTM
jgi:small GTP-binding protein